MLSTKKYLFMDYANVLVTSDIIGHIFLISG